jgi:integrase
MQSKRMRALDSRGRPVKGIYVRDGRYSAGFKCPQTGKWRMENLDADTITEARRERESLLAALREARAAAPAAATFLDMFAEYQASRTLADRTKKHERHLLDRHLGGIKKRKVQDVTATDAARILRKMRDCYSPWTCVGVYGIMRGSFAIAVRRGILTRSPMDGLAPAEIPKQRNAKPIARLDADRLDAVVAAGKSERWRVALALASYGTLRMGEIRGLRWDDLDLDANVLAVQRSLLPDGTPKCTKTEAGVRVVPILPALRRCLIEWKLRSPRTKPTDLVICTADGGPVQERNLRRALDDAKKTAGFDGGKERLSMHSLRHSCASLLATDLELPATTLARITGHADPGYTFRIYARDGRDDSAVVEDVLTRAANAGIGS